MDYGIRIEERGDKFKVFVKFSGLPESNTASVWANKSDLVRLASLLDVILHPKEIDNEVEFTG